MKYSVYLNNGNENLGVTEKTITVNEVCETSGNINLARAQELDPEVTELTLKNAGDLVSKAGVTVRAKAECESKFTDLLMKQGFSIQRKDVVEKAKVMKKDSTETPSGNGDNSNTNPTNPTTNSGDEMEP